MVIYIHMNPIVVNPLEADFSFISGQGLYNVVAILLSNVVSKIAVPAFFFISGFLFFINFQNWSWEGYKMKMRSRVKTLLIPYLLWNAVPFVIMAMGLYLKGGSIEEVQGYVAEKSWHIFYDCNVFGASDINWLGERLRSTGPFDLPLWFLRDLIVVSVLTPIIYHAIKKLGLFFIGFLFWAYISRIWVSLPGFSNTAFFFFSAGAYFALNKINVVQFATKFKYLFIPTCLILLVVVTVLDGANTTAVGHNLKPIFICTGVVTAFYVASIFVTKYGVKPNKLLVSSCFFIYAFHLVFFPLIGSPLSLTRRVLHHIIPGNIGIEEAVCYLASPVVTAGLCIVVLMLGRRFFPKLTLYFSGNK